MGFSLHTPRLRLRDYEHGDEAVVRASFLDPEQKQFNLTGQGTESYVAQHCHYALAQPRWQQRVAYDLAIVLPALRQTIGFCCLKRSEKDRRHGQLSWHISKPFWGRGYATETAACLVEFGFLALELDRLEATAFADNAASLRVMEKIGLRPLHNYGITNWWRGLTLGETRPVVSYQATREQWLVSRQSPDVSRQWSVARAQR
jgi:RimJ/RimL family protein N-acetyltransferase